MLNMAAAWTHSPLFSQVEAIIPLEIPWYSPMAEIALRHQTVLYGVSILIQILYTCLLSGPIGFAFAPPWPWNSGPLECSPRIGCHITLTSGTTCMASKSPSLARPSSLAIRNGLITIPVAKLSLKNSTTTAFPKLICKYSADKIYMQALEWMGVVVENVFIKSNTSRINTLKNAGTLFCIGSEVFFLPYQPNFGEYLNFARNDHQSGDAKWGTSVIWLVGYVAVQM